MMKAAARLGILSLALFASACNFDAAKTLAVRAAASMIFEHATAQAAVVVAPRPSKRLDCPAARLCALRRRSLEKGPKAVTQPKPQPQLRDAALNVTRHDVRV